MSVRRYNDHVPQDEFYPSPALHFVGFRGDEYWSAVKIWGKPGFIHRGWDSRAVQDIHPDDTVIFAKGTEADPMPRFTYHDLDE